MPDSQPVKVDDALIAQFIRNQSLEIEQRSQEVELERQKDANSFEYGRMALEAQERDRKHARECRRGERRDRYVVLIILSVLVVSLVGCSLYLGDREVARKVVEAVILLSAGAAGGYGVGRRRSGNRSADEE